MKVLRLSMCLIICTVFVFVGCVQEHDHAMDDTMQNKEQIDGTTQNKDQETIDDTVQNDFKEPVQALYIEVRSEQEFSQMREMIGCSDEKIIEEYLRTSGSGAKTKAELEHFVKLVDTIPYVSLIDGELAWACHEIGNSIDTGKPYNILSVSTKAQNGEWVRIEYHLDSLDAADKIANELEKADASAVLTKPIQSKDKKVTVYTEIRREQTAGKSIWWTADIDGIFARIIYGTDTMDTVKTESVFSGCTVNSFGNSLQ